LKRDTNKAGAIKVAQSCTAQLIKNGELDGKRMAINVEVSADTSAAYPVIKNAKKKNTEEKRHFKEKSVTRKCWQRWKPKTIRKLHPSQKDISRK